MTPTAALALADGTVFMGRGFGATGTRVAELVFNTAMTGYQEILTDPSYAGQVVTFTFPHIGNVGANPEDDEAALPVAEGWSSSGTRPSPRAGARPRARRPGSRGAAASASAAWTRAA
jgi:carbamoylphosphate synthase small subunit